MKKALRCMLLLGLVAALAVAGLYRWRFSSRPKLERGAASPPVRTALAALALVENPTARTYAAFGPGAGAFTNVFNHAGLKSVTNRTESADLVFVSGETAGGAVRRAEERCSTNGILAIHCDVRGKTFKAFQRELSALPKTWTWRLWFPGRSDCLVAVRPHGVSEKLRLAEVLDIFAREGLFDDFAHAGICSPPVLLASYAGSREEALPVFDWAEGEVVPECFVTKEIPSMDWIDPEGVDADIREPLNSEIRSMQVIRRLVLQGDIHSRAGRRDAAMDAWTKAVRRNPDDTLLLERICLLDVNAETFLKVGNFPMAAQCLETMVCLRPKDVATIRRLVRVLRQAGKGELAETVSRRADEIMKAELLKRKEAK